MELPPYEMMVCADAEKHTVHLAGEIDFAASIDLKPRLHEVADQCAQELILDLDKVTFIDSEGIKTLIAAFRWMQDKQGQARITRCSPCVHRVLTLTGLEYLISDYESSAAEARRLGSQDLRPS